MEEKIENTEKRLDRRRRASEDRQDTSEGMTRERDGAKDKIEQESKKTTEKRHIM